MKETVIQVGIDYPDDMLEWLKLNNHTGISVAHHNFQQNIINGIKSSDKSIDVKRMTAMPVGSYPRHCTSWSFTTSIKYKENSFTDIDRVNLGFVNLPVLKHYTRKTELLKMLRSFVDSTRRTYILIYDAYVPFLKIANKFKKEMKNVLVVPIVPDIPGKYCIEYVSYNALLKRIKDNEFQQLHRLIKNVDGSILLTEQMMDLLDIKDKKNLVMEGITNLIDVEISNESIISKLNPNNHHILLYAGELNPVVGLSGLLDAFHQIKSSDVELWICGSGEMEDVIKEASNIDRRIRFFGYLTGSEFDKVNSVADIYINPRKDIGLYTQYSFPSKTLEYLKTGKPVIAYKLSGVPKEYDDYLFYPDGDSTQALMKTIIDVMKLNDDDLTEIKNKQISFIKEKKTVEAQGKRILEFLRSL